MKGTVLMLKTCKSFSSKVSLHFTELFLLPIFFALTKAKDQLISEANSLVLNSSKIRIKNLCRSSKGKILRISRSFFGKIGAKKTCF